ncbi:hypothetical protein [Amycolatopsis sp. cmx-4-83]|uniref:hypothetical protein n=1 Tax=Amycolatopsis sp. cmx-4-83 TaxID=2790940 RepID=UPI00397DC8A6
MKAFPALESGSASRKAAPGDARSADPRWNQPQSRCFQSLLSFTLGNSAVRLLEMTNVSATLMSGGTWCPPNPIVSVTDRHGRDVGGVNDYADSPMVFADGRRPGTLRPGPPVHIGNCGHRASGATVAAHPCFDAMQRLIAGVPEKPAPGPRSSIPHLAELNRSSAYMGRHEQGMDRVAQCRVGGVDRGSGYRRRRHDQQISTLRFAFGASAQSDEHLAEKCDRAVTLTEPDHGTEIDGVAV